MTTAATALDEGRLQERVGRFAGDLGARTGTDERYVREWLCAQAASAYVEYDATNETPLNLILEARP